MTVIERLLDRDCLLSGMTAIDLGPGRGISARRVVMLR